MPLGHVKAVAAAVIAAEPKPYIVLDLVVDPPFDSRPTLRTIRFRSLDFDARTFVKAETDPQKALAAMLSHVLKVSGAVALPNPQAVLGRPFPRYASLGEYERQVVGARSAA